MEWREGRASLSNRAGRDRAAALVGSKEYRFLSAVFPYDAQGRPLELRMGAAVADDPGVVGMQALAALSALTSQPGRLANPSKRHP
ncbi:phage protease [Aeromonas veronii]